MGFWGFIGMRAQDRSEGLDLEVESGFFVRCRLHLWDAFIWPSCMGAISTGEETLNSTS